MNDYNWRQFTKRVSVHSSTERIYNAWATQNGLESWFLRTAEFRSPDGFVRKRDESVMQGDRYKWLWFGYDDSIVEQKEILAANGVDELQFGFSGGCIVHVTIKEEQGEMICELQQTMPMNDPVEQRYFFIECGKGWTFYLANLKSILEGGLDLRNKKESLKSVINA